MSRAPGWLLLSEYEVSVANYLLSTSKVDAKIRRQTKRHPIPVIEWWRVEEANRQAMSLINATINVIKTYNAQKEKGVTWKENANSVEESQQSLESPKMPTQQAKSAGIESSNET